MNFEVQHLPTKKYLCVHCRDESTQFLCYSFETLDDVYGHWLSNHTELPVAKQFLFYYAEFVGCHYCGFSGFYGRLRKHHANNHPNNAMIVTRQIEREQCAFCHHTGHNMPLHFVQTHRLVLEAGVFNPVCFTRNTLAELLAIDIHRKRLCGHCGATFETNHEANEHHYNIHSDKQKSVIEVNDVRPNQISYLICGLCGNPTRPEDYYAHVEMDQAIFSFQPTQFSVDPREPNPAVSYYNKLYKDYLKTKVVFGNRLVVFKQNLIDSEYDDSQQFADLINQIVGRTFKA